MRSGERGRADWVIREALSGAQPLRGDPRGQMGSSCHEISPEVMGPRLGMQMVCGGGKSGLLGA